MLRQSHNISHFQSQSSENSGHVTFEENCLNMGEPEMMYRDVIY